MQNVKYPLPPLWLGPIIDRCAHDHTHRCDEYCVDDAEFCSRRKKDNENNITPVIVSIEAGYGRHVHDEVCDAQALERGYECMKDCEDSDWVVELQYSSNGWHAVYGITRAGDVQDICLWAD